MRLHLGARALSLGLAVIGLAVLAASRRLAGRGDPPVLVFDPGGPIRALAIHYTGDAGPTAFDRRMARYWAARGMRVVVVNSLRYFFRQTPPDRQAEDLRHLVAAHGRTEDAAFPVLLAGFSFGADAVPFAHAALDPGTQASIGLIALVSPTPRIAFHSSPRSVLGLLSGHRDVAAAIATLPAARVLCVMGADDRRNACRDPRLDGLARITFAGGHRLTDPPETVAAAILAAFDARPSPAAPGPRPRPGG